MAAHTPVHDDAPESPIGAVLLPLFAGAAVVVLALGRLIGPVEH